MKYHLVAFLVVAIWGSTFVFTKMLLLAGLSPAQIFTLRFLIAYTLLSAYDLAVNHSRFRVWGNTVKDELLMVLLGLTGGSAYFLSENAAMLYTTATNTSLIVCSCPLFAMLLVALVYRKTEHFTRIQVFGSLLACLGMAVVVLNGHFVLHLSPLGDALAFGACLCWAFYSLLIKIALERGKGDAGTSYSSLFITRKVFGYGLLTIIPYYVFVPSERWIFTTSIFEFFNASILLNLLFLGVVASMGCYLLWNWVIGKLGAVVATNWVYFNPITTIIFAWWLLNERITVWFLLGSAFILTGMFLCDKKR